MVGHCDGSLKGCFCSVQLVVVVRDDWLVGHWLVGQCDGSFREEFRFAKLVVVRSIVLGGVTSRNALCLP